MGTAGYTFSDLELASLRKKAWQMLDVKRIPHVSGCEEEAVCLARRWGESPSAAAAAAILHDVTKRLSAKEQLALVKQYAIVCDDALLASPKLLHAVTGAAVAKAEFCMPDEICNAIRWHTTGKPEMTLLEELTKQKRWEDLALGLSMSLEEVRNGGAEPYIDTVLANSYYQKIVREEKNN